MDNPKNMVVLLIVTKILLLRIIQIFSLKYVEKPCCFLPILHFDTLLAGLKIIFQNFHIHEDTSLYSLTTYFAMTDDKVRFIRELMYP